jgi:hypothetical protein
MASARRVAIFNDDFCSGIGETFPVGMAQTLMPKIKS